MQMNPSMDILGTQIAPKIAILGHFRRILKQRSATCESRSRPPPSSFSLKLCVIVLHTHRYHAPKFHPNQKHHDGVLIFTHFARAAACLLLAACCWLAAAAAKPGRSTLDTKKGYKTKTGSTSSVTLTLALALTPEGGQGEVMSARAPPPHHPKSPHLDPPPQPTLPTPPPHRPSLNPPLPWGPSAYFYCGGGGGGLRTKARRRPTRDFPLGVQPHTGAGRPREIQPVLFTTDDD